MVQQENENSGNKSIEEQRAYYKERWAGETSVNSLQLERCAAILHEIAALECVRPRVLDLGCGTGWLTAILGEIGEAMGVDLSAEEARRRYPHIQFAEADLATWEPSNVAPFDIVVCQEVIEHLLNQRALLRLTACLLKPGGHLILTTPNARIINACSEEWRRGWLRQPIENIISIPELKRLLAEFFDVTGTTTVISGFGERGILRVINSTRLHRILKGTWLQPLVTQGALSAGYGLHIVAVARKREGPTS
jgi:2-polyprenyl-3-methyl-5-hydroxy-6-metoxy-1,4-benzoquinol methylase